MSVSGDARAAEAVTPSAVVVTPPAPQPAEAVEHTVGGGTARFAPASAADAPEQPALPAAPMGRAPSRPALPTGLRMRWSWVIAAMSVALLGGIVAGARHRARDDEPRAAPASSAYLAHAPLDPYEGTAPPSPGDIPRATVADAAAFTTAASAATAPAPAPTTIGPHEGEARGPLSPGSTASTVVTAAPVARGSTAATTAPAATPVPQQPMRPALAPPIRRRAETPTSPPPASPEAPSPPPPPKPPEPAQASHRVFGVDQ